MKKVALIQNRIQPGGRFQVMAEMILVLNQNSIVPDLLCFRSSVDVEKAKAFYGTELKFNLKTIGGETPMPFEWNIYWFNRKVSPRLASYDLIINHNNTSYGLATNQKLLSYVHFPRKYRLKSGLQDIHTPEKGKASFINAGKDLLNLARCWYSFDKNIKANEIFLANSEFTKHALCEVYQSLQAHTVEVLYPPVAIPEELGNLGMKQQVVSLGRIAAAKRQLEQIRIAEKLPELHLTIVGFVSEQAYHQQCIDYIESKAIKNVSILANASKEDRDKALDKAAFFIHNMRNEPFGITPVQAITKGCLPLVHNSGGQKEVVPNPALRFASVDDAAQKLQTLASKDTEYLQKELLELQLHVRQYSATAFSERFEQLLLSLQL